MYALLMVGVLVLYLLVDDVVRRGRTGLGPAGGAGAWCPGVCC